MAEEYFGLTCQSLCDALSTLKGAYEATNTDFNLYWSVGEWGKCVHSISESVHVVLSDTIDMLKHQQAEIEQLEKENGTLKLAIQSTPNWLNEKRPEVVRCKGCKNGEKVNSVYLCGKSRGFGIAHEPSWYCADGERKDD